MLKIQDKFLAKVQWIDNALDPNRHIGVPCILLVILTLSLNFSHTNTTDWINITLFITMIISCVQSGTYKVLPGQFGLHNAKGL